MIGKDIFTIFEAITGQNLDKILQMAAEDINRKHQDPGNYSNNVITNEEVIDLEYDDEKKTWK